MLKTIMTCLFGLFLCAFVQAAEQRSEVPIDDSPSLGPVDAPVTIIEFIDFQ